MSQIHYLAYGSNLHPQRLLERTPSAYVIGVVQIPGLKLAFHKLSTDGSGKCDLFESSPDSLSYGVLYALSPADKTILDEVEGLGRGYHETSLRLSCNNISYQPYAYLAAHTHVDAALRPYHWYKAFVLTGARHHNLPKSYIDEIESVDSMPDPDTSRDASNMALLARMLSFNG